MSSEPVSDERANAWGPLHDERTGKPQPDSQTGFAPAAKLAGAIEPRVRAAAREIGPRSDEHDRKATFPADGIATLWRAGLGNLTLSTERGGDGLSLLDTARAVRRIGAADASVALIWVMHLAHLMLIEDPRFGLSDQARNAIIRSSLNGPALINALRVEPELGTPARGGTPATTASQMSGSGAGDWRINGHKIYCTGSHGLRWLLVWASVAPGDAGDVRVGPFVVDGNSSGIEVRETWDHLGMRASASHDVILTDVAVPAGWTGVLEPAGGASGAGRDPVAVAVLNLLLSSLYLGVAEAARDRLADYLHERVPTSLGTPLASLPRFQVAVGEIASLLVCARQLLDGLARDLDAGGEQARTAAADDGPIKMVVSRAVISATEQAVGLVGNPGLSRHLPLQRHLRDAMCSRTHTPQDDTIAAELGRRTLARENA
jgi:alkylation response protein AidB-like acyl-CoA dehydrogenase